MKEVLTDLVKDAPSPLHGRNTVREYLQARILGILQAAGAMVPLAFHGGTALRFLYASGRYSEDLDFTLERPGRAYDFRSYLRSAQSAFKAEGYDVSVKVNDAKTVHNAFIRFRGLLYELGLSAQSGEVLAVKIEVDTKPPAGAGLSTTLVRRHVMLNLQHHDRASLLAGKLHAVLQRPYVKGRDMHDLLWYLSNPDWPSPNLALLNNALVQTDWPHPTLTETTWRQAVAQKMEGVAWERLVADVRPFLERDTDANFLTRENLRRVLGRG